MSKHNKERNKLIKEYKLEGRTHQEIAEIFGISRQRVFQILNPDKPYNQVIHSFKKEPLT